MSSCRCSGGFIQSWEFIYRKLATLLTLAKTTEQPGLGEAAHRAVRAERKGTVYKLCPFSGRHTFFPHFVLIKSIFYTLFVSRPPPITTAWTTWLMHQSDIPSTFRPAAAFYVLIFSGQNVTKQKFLRHYYVLTARAWTFKSSPVKPAG